MKIIRTSIVILVASLASLCATAQQSGGGIWFTSTGSTALEEMFSGGPEYTPGYVWDFDGTNWVYGPPTPPTHYVPGDHHCPEHPIEPVVPPVPSPVPLPAAVWLFASAMLGLLGIARTRRKNNECL